MQTPELSVPGKVSHEVVYLNKGQDLDTDGNKIVSVISGKIGNDIKGVLEQFDSSVYHSGNITALEDSVLSIFSVKKLDQILNKIDVNAEYGDYCRAHWTSLYGLTGVEDHKKVDLYRGDQITEQVGDKTYMLNLWFCGPDVDCLFHNQHSFYESHTGVAGDGFMQKCVGETDHTLVETFPVMPGTSHRDFSIPGQKEANGNPKYPFHRWLGGKTGNVWLVIEEVV